MSYYNGSSYTFTWNGRELATAVKGSTSISYKYGADGLRTQKTVGSTVYNYYYADGLLVRQTWGTNYMDFLYDESGSAYSFIYNGTQYYYVKNLQGDVMRIMDTSGTVVANYYYDAWGKVTNSGNIIGLYNPIRYRGYYYDTDTGFYYLQSRYYDPAIKRFISADDASLLGANGDFTSLNLYAYCGNNPVARADDGGEAWHILAGAVIGGLIGGISSIVGQAVSGQKINWAEVGVSAASGMLTGAITAACPGMGAVATGIVHGAVGAGTYVATELVNGRTPTVAGTLATGVTSGVLAGGTKAIGNLFSNKGFKIQKIGKLEASNHVNDPQFGIKYQINKSNGRPTIRSIEFHFNHSHKGYKPHWQQNSWNPWNNSVSSMKHWSWWGKRI